MNLEGRFRGHGSGSGSGGPRDHGKPHHLQAYKPPEVVAANPERPCPHCSCDTTFDVLVQVREPVIDSPILWGHFIGCAACEWASNMNVYTERPEVED